MKRSRTVTIAVLVVMLLLAAFIVTTSVLRSREAQQQPVAQESQQNLPAGGDTTTAASATPSVNSTVQASVEKTHQKLDPDTSKAPEVVTAWMTAFTTRSSADDTLWEDTVTPWSADELLGELEESGSQHIAAHAPTSFVELQVGDPLTEWGRDTPIRWSRQVSVIFTDAKGQKYLAPYRVQAQRGDEGWIITSASYNGTTITVK